MSQVVFRSKNAKLRVSFDVRQFGVTSGQLMQSGQVVEAKLRWEDIKFFDVATGRYGLVTLDEHSPYVEMLRRHKANEKNGGADFWEQTAETTDYLAWQSGEVQCQIPKEGLQPADLDTLRKLLAFRDKPIAPPKLPQAAELFNAMLPRLRVRGLAPLPVNCGTQLTKARIVELLHALEHGKVWSPDEPKEEQGAA